MSIQEIPRIAASAPDRMARHVAAGALLRFSQWLVRMASRLLHVERRPVVEPVLEFYAEAGAPEGALYVNGQLVCRLPGVERL